MCSSARTHLLPPTPIAAQPRLIPQPPTMDTSSAFVAASHPFLHRNAANVAIDHPLSCAPHRCRRQRFFISMTSVQPQRPSTQPNPQSSSSSVSGPYDDPDALQEDFRQDECPVYCYVACSPTRSDYLERVLTSNVYDVVDETPVERAKLLSDRLGHNVWLKREDTTDVKSFKVRGAYNMMSKARRSTLSNGVIAASAGNHAQGVALAAQKLNIHATIVMPAVTPQIKVNAVRRRGATTILHGDTFDEAKELALTLAERDNALFVPPFDHPDVIAGQATVGLELVRQMSDIDAIFVPVGGGGLIAGIATVIKRLRPQTKVIGVEPRDSAAMHDSMRAGHRVALKRVGTFADGVAVIEVGEETFRLCRDLVDEVVLVSNDEICAAIKDVFEDTRSILEPAGALAIAGLKHWVSTSKKQNYCDDEDDDDEFGNKRKLNLVAIASGANTNFDVLRHVSERAEIGEGREGIFAVTIPERPGSFRQLIQHLGAETSITEFNYRLRNNNIAHVFVGARISNRDEAEEIVERVTSQGGFQAVDLTDDEMAKLHVRHQVGGVASIKQTGEAVYRFEFPERPGALFKFLAELPSKLNITMFHYRNHGADVGRVLVGLTFVDEGQSESNGTSSVDRQAVLLDQFVNRLGYKYVREDDNVAYRLFLS